MGSAPRRWSCAATFSALKAMRFIRPWVTRRRKRRMSTGKICNRLLRCIGVQVSADEREIFPHRLFHVKSDQQGQPAEEKYPGDGAGAVVEEKFTDHPDDVGAEPEADGDVVYEVFGIATAFVGDFDRQEEG